MVALLTYDDSVKRLLFAKKIPNHDVLSGLLATLQARIKTRRSTASNGCGAGTSTTSSSGRQTTGIGGGPTSAAASASSGAHNRSTNSLQT